MKKHCFLVIFSILLFCALKVQGQSVLPTQPFGVAYAQGGSYPAIPCPNKLVGYVNFEYTGTGATPTNWDISNVRCYGPAQQTIAVRSGLNYNSGSVYNTNQYTIVANPSSMNGGGQTFQNVTHPLGGGFFTVHNAGDNMLIYTIKGLNTMADVTNFTQTNPPRSRELIYYVRVKMRNFGTQGGCGRVGNNVAIRFRNQDGQDFSNGGRLYDANMNRGNDGRYMTTNTPACSGNNQNNQSWNGNDQINNNPVGTDGEYAVFEGAFMITADRGNDAQFRNDDGFQILFKCSDQNGDNVIGIESIEVYGCLPMKIEARDGLDPAIVGNNFCENGPVELSAVGAGFGNSITWYKGATPTGTPIGYGRNISITAPSGVGSTATYWAVGEFGTESITIHSVFCCSALGASTLVFSEDFPLNPATRRTCGAATISDLVPGRGTTTYTYVGVLGGTYVNPAGQTQTHNNACELNEGYYAITTNSNWSFWAGRTIVNEHTGTANSGAMMINADANVDKYFYTLPLTGLCEKTKYEFSAWYVSVAHAGSERPSDIDFQIWEGGTYNQTTGVHTGGTRIALPDGQTSTTGLFGGTSNAEHNSSFIWRKKTITFSTPPSSSTTTQYYLKLKNNSGEASGNDLLIDDIKVVKCVPTLYLYENNTNNTSISVCSDVPITLSTYVAADVLDEISGGSGTIYAQLMRSTNQINWTAVGTPQQVTAGGTITFTVPAPATTGVPEYYRVKLSGDQTRAANVGASLTNGCFNDVITQTFDVTRDGSMAVINTPTATPLTYICNGLYVASYTINVDIPSDATEWGWVLNDPSGANVTYSNNPADASITVTQTGDWYFFYKKDDCRGWTKVTVTVHTAINIPTITITQPGMVPVLVCNGSPLNLIPPTIPAHIPVDEQGWLLNGAPFTSGTTVTMADNGKTLTYFAKNDCDRKESNGVIIRVGQTYNTPISDQHCFGAPYTANGFNITSPPMGVSTHTINPKTIDGCDSIVTLTLTVVTSMVNANVDNPQIVCGNNNGNAFSVLVTPTGNPADMFPTFYEVIFEPNNAGFQNIPTTAFNGGNSIEIPIPADIYPNNYPFKLFLNNASSECGGNIYDITLEVRYPNSIMTQKWNNVIALLNYNYNGRYGDFKGYQWYESGRLLPDETMSYYYKKGAPFVAGTEYSVEILRADGTKMRSCPYEAHAAAEPTSTVPVIVSGNGNVTIYFSSPRKVTANIYSVTGILVGSANLDGDIVSMPAPPQGTYLLEILSKENNARQMFPFVSR